jgi:hypothetical protein
MLTLRAEDLLDVYIGATALARLISAWTTGMGERSNAVLRTATPGGDERK